ncbi:MAG: hypothetical protein LPJ89_04685 [Hymenobacteraceae bacterium]|nr:hypothetical protein [Hymenobacteraceae bacterium]
MKKELIIASLLLIFCLFFFVNVQAQNQPLPKEEEKKLIALALEKAFVTDKNLPDYKYLDDKEKIIISTEMPVRNRPEAEAQTLTKEKLPEFETVKFKLKTPAQIKRKAKKGNLLYARVNTIDIYTGDVAIVEVELVWEMSDRSRKRGLLNKSGAGYTLLYSRKNGGWDNGRIIRNWMN